MHINDHYYLSRHNGGVLVHIIYNSVKNTIIPTYHNAALHHTTHLSTKTFLKTEFGEH